MFVIVVIIRQFIGIGGVMGTFFGICELLRKLCEHNMGLIQSACKTRSQTPINHFAIKTNMTAGTRWQASDKMSPPCSYFTRDVCWVSVGTTSQTVRQH